MNRLLIIFFLCLVSSISNGQSESILNPSIDTTDSFSTRKKIFNGVTIGGYVTVSSGLYYAWYNNFDQSSFHFFNDSKEWLFMDKIGHSYGAYMQSTLLYSGAKWAGYDKKESLRRSAIGSIVGQLTIEVFDGFSTQWGFSWYDLGFNALGTGLFTYQQAKFDKQIIKLKMSYWPVDYQNLNTMSAEGGIATTSLSQRANDLFGSNGLERFVKDYNGQSIWASVRIKELIPAFKSDWLALALGYSAHNLYGGFSNEWTIGNERFLLNGPEYQRYSQWILALDVDFSALKPKRQWVGQVLNALNVFKLPTPGVSYSRVEGLRLHLLFLN